MCVCMGLCLVVTDSSFCLGVCVCMCVCVSTQSGDISLVKKIEYKLLPDEEREKLKRNANPFTMG